MIQGQSVLAIVHLDITVLSLELNSLCRVVKTDMLMLGLHQDFQLSLLTLTVARQMKETVIYVTPVIGVNQVLLILSHVQSVITAKRTRNQFHVQLRHLETRQVQNQRVNVKNVQQVTIVQILDYVIKKILNVTQAIIVLVAIVLLLNVQKDIIGMKPLVNVETKLIVLLAMVYLIE